jgi:hypothetical protein
VHLTVPSWVGMRSRGRPGPVAACRRPCADWQGASRKLGIHRHSLRQRISRIELETGLDLDSAHTRAATLLILLAQARDAG